MLLVGFPYPSVAGEIAERQAIATEMRAAWLREDFARLDQLYRGYRDSKDRLPSGTFKAGRMFYAMPGVIGVPAEERRRPKDHEAALVKLEAMLLRWQKQAPTSSLAALALTETYISHGFFYRGEGPASSVAPTDFKRYREFIDRASNHLIGSEFPIEHDEAWYFSRIKLMQYQSAELEQFVKLVDESTSKFPDFYDLYFVGSGRMEPKWGGSMEGLDWLADLAARRTRAAEGETGYARVYWSIGQGADYRNMLFDVTKADWTRMRAGFDDLVRRYPDPWNLNNYAWFACLARDASTLKALFDRIGENVDRGVWHPQRLSRCRNFAYEIQ